MVVVARPGSVAVTRFVFVVIHDDAGMDGERERRRNKEEKRKRVV
jgi:hypothetical protein